MPSSRPITNSGCGVGPLYSRTRATGVVAVPGDAPARPRELALLEVADRVGREQPVALEERAQQGLVRRRPGDDRAAPADRDGGHQPRPSWPRRRGTDGRWVGRRRGRSRPAGRHGCRIALKPGIAAQRACARSVASRRPASNGARTTPSSVTIPVISSAGVTSKAGLRTSVPGGAMRTPRTSRTSSALRSSIGMAVAVGRRRGRPSWSARRRRTGSRAGPRGRPACRSRPCSRCRRWRRPGPPRPGRRPPRPWPSGARRPRRGAACAGRRPGPAPRSSAGRPAGTAASRRPRRGRSRPAWWAAWTTPSAVPYWPQASGPVLQWVRIRSGPAVGDGQDLEPEGRQPAVVGGGLEDDRVGLGPHRVGDGVAVLGQLAELRRSGP